MRLVESTTYNCWRNMRQRCGRPTHPEYHNYGARGITVCERWQVFANFLADMGEKPKGLTIERINNNGNYEPGNCKWATLIEQNRNHRLNRLFTVNGQTKTLAEWCLLYRVHRHTVEERLNRGWQIEQALSIPAAGKRDTAITHKGETLTVAAWARKLGLRYTTLYRRLFVYHWPIERALVSADTSL